MPIGIFLYYLVCAGCYLQDYIARLYSLLFCIVIFTCVFLAVYTVWFTTGTLDFVVKQDTFKVMVLYFS